LLLSLLLPPPLPEPGEEKCASPFFEDQVFWVGLAG
jgi:hypothetical protein